MLRGKGQRKKSVNVTLDFFQALAYMFSQMSPTTVTGKN
jgi:hypothetical protein